MSEIGLLLNSKVGISQKWKVKKYIFQNQLKVNEGLNSLLFLEKVKTTTGSKVSSQCSKIGPKKSIFPDCPEYDCIGQKGQ